MPKPIKSIDGGRCFEAALVVAMELGHDATVICHGKPVGLGEHNYGQRYWHAWCELPTEDGGWMVFDGSRWLNTMGQVPVMAIPQQRYYFIGQIVAADVLRFTLEEATGAMELFNHSGPWCDYQEDEL